VRVVVRDERALVELRAPMGRTVALVLGLVLVLDVVRVLMAAMGRTVALC
jgi:hypothetical protein